MNAASAYWCETMLQVLARPRNEGAAAQLQTLTRSPVQVAVDGHKRRSVAKMLEGSVQYGVAEWPGPSPVGVHRLHRSWPRVQETAKTPSISISTAVNRVISNP